MNLDCILANRVAIADGRFAGEVEVMVDDNRKDEAALRVIAKFGVAPAATAVLGDTDGDRLRFERP